MSEQSISIKGARVNNLKNIDLEIPRNKLIVITGLSGSGSRHWHSIRYMPRGNVVMSRAFRLMQGNFSDE